MKLPAMPIDQRGIGMNRFAIRLLAAGFGCMLVSAHATEALAACGELVVSKGDVKIENGKTKQAAPAPQGSKICSGDTIIAGPQSRAKIKMEDGNELNISPDSKIALEQYEYKPAENKKKVLLNVLSGKVRAATAKEGMYNDTSTGGQANTFQVRTKSAVAGVRGTDFLTGYNPANNKSEVLTFKGQVEFGQPGPGGQILNPVQVGAGQRTEAFSGRAPEPPKAIPAAELDKMNVETKADTSMNNGGNQPGSQAAGSEKKDGENDRAPAAGESRTPATSMIETDGSGSVINEPPPPPPTSAPPPSMPLPSVYVPPPTSTFINSAIQGGPAKVNVKINFQ